MRWTKWLAIPILVSVSGLASGCRFDFFAKKLYMGEGQLAELAEDKNVKVFYTDKKTGTIKQGIVEAKAHTFYIGRLKK